MTTRATTRAGVQRQRKNQFLLRGILRWSWAIQGIKVFLFQGGVPFYGAKELRGLVSYALGLTGWGPASCCLVKPVSTWVFWNLAKGLNDKIRWVMKICESLQMWPFKDCLEEIRCLLNETMNLNPVKASKKVFCCWYLHEIYWMSLVTIMDRREKIHGFLPTVWMCGRHGTFVLAVGNCHTINRLPRSCSQSNLSVGRFMEGFWDLN